MSDTGVEMNNKPEIRFYRHLAEVEDECEFEQCITDVVRKLGYSDYIYGLANARMGANGHVASSWSEPLRAYSEEKYYVDDMILHHCLRSERSLFMSAVENYIAGAPIINRQLSRTREMIERFKQFGFNDVYYIPLKTQCGSGNAIFAVAMKNGSQQEFKELVCRTYAMLYLLAEAVDYIAASRFSSHFAATESREEMILTSKPLLLMETLAKRNMTLKRAAEALCMSLDTANKHVASAKKALGAKTMASAVYLTLKKRVLNCDYQYNIK